MSAMLCHWLGQSERWVQAAPAPLNVPELTVWTTCTQAAAIAETWLTAFQILITIGDVQKDDFVLVSLSCPACTAHSL